MKPEELIETLRAQNLDDEGILGLLGAAIDLIRAGGEPETKPETKPEPEQGGGETDDAKMARVFGI